MQSVAAAVRAQVPRVYADLTSMGQPAWPHFQVQAMIVMDQIPLAQISGPRIFGLKRYVELAARRCGRATALSSVLVFLEFPLCQIPCSEDWAYVARTRRGWRLWTSHAT
jgi:hypothetical protein